MKIWLAQHLFALGRALRQSFGVRSGFLFNVVVVAIALTLPYAGVALLENVLPLSQQLTVEPEISLLLKTDLPRADAQALANTIRASLNDQHIGGKLEFISKEKALAAFKTRSGLSEAIDALDGNPLPDAYVIHLANFQSAADANRVDALATQLRSLAGVDTVQIDSDWIKRLAALLHVLQLTVLFLAATLGVVVVAVVFNTIRLQVLTQSEEIEVSRLVGATDSFIHRPFLYGGTLLGALAGALALVIVTLAMFPINDAVREFAQLYASNFQLRPVDPLTACVLLGTSAALGWLGAMISVRRHLGRIR